MESMTTRQWSRFDQGGRLILVWGFYWIEPPNTESWHCFQALALKMICSLPFCAILAVLIGATETTACHKESYSISVWASSTLLVQSLGVWYNSSCSQFYLELEPFGSSLWSSNKGEFASAFSSKNLWMAVWKTETPQVSFIKIFII